jgi:hypothetical protein
MNDFNVTHETEQYKITIYPECSLDFEGQEVMITDPCYWFKENSKNKIEVIENQDDLWSVFCDLMFEAPVGAFMRTASPSLLNEVWKKKLANVPEKDHHKTNLSIYDLPPEYRLDTEGVVEFTLKRKTTEFTFKFIYTSTAHGDGEYDVRDGRRGMKHGTFCVDAGMYCAVAVNDLKKFIPFSQKERKENWSGRCATFVRGVRELECDGANMKSSYRGTEVWVVTDDSDDETCENCGTSFRYEEGYDEYCSHECYEEDNRTCHECGNDDRLDVEDWNGNWFCDTDCHDKYHQEGEYRECNNCRDEVGSDPVTDDDDYVYCCQDCHDEYNEVGEYAEEEEVD